ncbi:MAG: hypothetical protein Q7S62_00435 [bacterium]|nr:hypothetical protein [bacterium]
MATSSLRTQIILPKALRQEIERVRRLTRESLGEYLRKAAQERLEKEKKRSVNLALLVRKIGTVKKSGWEKVNVLEWQRKMREDRDI